MPAIFGSQTGGVFGAQAYTPAVGPTIVSVVPNESGASATITFSEAYTSPLSVTYDGVPISGLIEATPTTATATIPDDGQLGANTVFVATDNTGTGPAYNQTKLPPSGWAYFTATAASGNLPANSLFVDVPNISIGSQVAYQIVNGGETFTLDSEGRLISEVAPGNYSIPFYINDPGNNYIAFPRDTLNTTVADTTPEYNFTPILDAPLNTPYELKAAITDLDEGVDVEVTAGSFDLSNDDSNWSTGPIPYASGLTQVRAQITSSSNYSTLVESTGSVNGVERTAQVTTISNPGPVVSDVEVEIDFPSVELSLAVNSIVATIEISPIFLQGSLVVEHLTQEINIDEVVLGSVIFNHSIIVVA